MEGGVGITKSPQSSRLEFTKCLSDLENGTDKDFTPNLKNGATICWGADLVKLPDVPHAEKKQRFYA